MPANSRTRASKATASKDTAAIEKPSRHAALKKTNARATRSTKKTVQEEEEENVEASDEEEEDEEEEEEEEHTANLSDDSDEETFKIHTPKQAASTTSSAPVAALSAPKWEDEESDSSDSDAAPEAVSLSSSKEKILSKQDKEKEFLAKVQADQKAKRRARDQQLKQQKEEAKQRAQLAEDDRVSEPKATTRSGLPALLPMDILESVAMNNDSEPLSAVAGQKRKLHMRPEDFALLELELEMKKEARERKKLAKVQRNVGPVTVKVLNQSNLPKGQAIPETVVDFRKQHFFGNKIQRKDAVLNFSQRNMGAASQFRRRR